MDNRELITKLDILTNDWRVRHHLFCGGCAYSAAILSNILTKAGIKYEIISYSESKNHNPIKDYDSCAHIAVRVRMGNKRIYIGGDFRKHPMNRFYKPTILGQVDPRVLLKYYRDLYSWNEWNCLYNVSNNSTYSRLCNNIYKEYVNC